MSERGRKKKVLLLSKRPQIEKGIKLTDHQTTYCASSINFGGIKVFVENTKAEPIKEVEEVKKKFVRFLKSDPNNIKISTEFKNLPSSTDVCCWWCTEQFENHPISLPIHQKHITTNFIYHGIFCSWNCSKAFSNSQNDSRIGVRNDFMNSLVKKIYGKFTHIYPSPARYRLKKFGGDLDLEEFRNHQYLDKNEAIDPIKITPITLSSIKFT